MLRGLAQGTAAELEVTIRTGRTHQIRVHLDSIGHPVLGDPMYGGRRTTLPPPWPVPPRLLLHAASLRFTHPRTGEAVQVDAPLPKDYLTYCEQLSTP
jgi:23S rRNA pseudouridine1911/1915/1917 synthase